MVTRPHSMPQSAVGSLLVEAVPPLWKVNYEELYLHPYFWDTLSFLHPLFFPKEKE